MTAVEGSYPTTLVSGVPVELTSLTVGDLLQFNGQAFLNSSYANVQTPFSSISLTGTITQYNGIATAGNGVPSLVAAVTTTSVSTTQTNLINYTPPSTAGTYRIQANIATTAGTNTGNTTCTITHKSAAGIAITHLPPFEQTGSATLLTASTAASKSFSLLTYVFNIDNSGTAITATFTVTGTVAEYISVTLEQLI